MASGPKGPSRKYKTLAKPSLLSGVNLQDRRADRGGRRARGCQGARWLEKFSLVTYQGPSKELMLLVTVAAARNTPVTWTARRSSPTGPRTGGPPSICHGGRRGADLFEQPGSEIARALLGLEAPAGGTEEADAQPGALWEADEVNCALDRAAHDLGFRHGLRESSEPASGTERLPACPSAFKEYADAGTGSELGGSALEGSNVARAPAYRNLSHPVEDLRQQRVLPQRRLRQCLDLALLNGSDPDHDRVPPRVVVAGQ
jgi:hypothetical protein